MSHLALVGSRTFTDYEVFCRVIDGALKEWGNPTVLEVVSGDAAGADALARRWASDRSIEIKVFAAEWSKYGRSAGIRRNTDIVDRATHVIAFPSCSGRGTQDTIRKAQAQNKPLVVQWID
jgi:hypothetical protein